MGGLGWFHFGVGAFFFGCFWLDLVCAGWCSLEVVGAGRCSGRFAGGVGWWQLL